MANNKKLRQLVKELEEETAKRGEEKTTLENSNKTLQTQIHQLDAQVLNLQEDANKMCKADEETRLDIVL